VDDDDDDAWDDDDGSWDDEADVEVLEPSARSPSCWT
jgi:hypothetical protein